MSLSSADSSYSRGSGLRRRGGVARSPVPYREHAMDYEPTVICSRCGRKAPRWISWSPANPGRRYYSCVDSHHGFIDWHDTPTTPFLRQLLGDLRDKVWRLEDELAGQSPEGEVVLLREELEKKNALVAEMGARCDSKHEMEMYKSLFYGMVLFVAGLVAGFFLFQ
ncbi:unnamed protein product [Triticum turgidum subsp. durum]|uniref:GRF-type domain-containing protein n=1 Tax=Triticum turgidum subsp. durum TaxID=4567 RepID=A0A9R1AJ07_TRITD|nr:unnamed protein product [Triticum turgidum subsp. durum]